MIDLNNHYRLLLGLNDDWRVVEVDLDLPASRVTMQFAREIRAAIPRSHCPECGIKTIAVDRGLERRETDSVQHVGIDEKSF